MKKVDGKPCKLPENQTNEDIKLAKGEYCPFCQRVIYPSNVEEFMNGEHDGFIFVHDDVAHDEDFDFKPLN